MTRMDTRYSKLLQSQLLALARQLSPLPTCLPLSGFQSPSRLLLCHSLLLGLIQEEEEEAVLSTA